MNALYLTVDGVVGTEPRRATVNGQPLLSFRMVANERRYDNVTQGWVDVHSSWITVSCFRNIARNVDASIKKGDRVIVHGKMRVKDYVTSDGRQRTSVDVEASSIGHDLKFGTTRFEPMRSPDGVDDRLREQADALIRELAELPQESVEQLLAQRAALAAAEVVDDEPDYDEEDDEPGSEADEEDVGGRVPQAVTAAES